MQFQQDPFQSITIASATGGGLENGLNIGDQMGMFDMGKIPGFGGDVTRSVDAAIPDTTMSDSSEGKKEVTYPVVLGQFPNNQQLSYTTTGTALWSCSIGTLNVDKDGDKIQAYSLPTLNAALEQAYIYKFTAGAAANNANMGPVRKRHATASSRVRHIPTNIHEFAAAIHYLGIVDGTGQLGPQESPYMEPDVTMMLTGRPDRLGDMWPTGNVGDIIGHYAKAFDNPFSVQYDFDGSVIGPKTQGQFLQVRPMVLKEAAYPFNCSDFMNPQQDDLGFFEMAVVRQKIYQKDPDTGLLRMTSPALNTEYNIEAALYRDGIFMPIGVIHGLPGPRSSEQEVLMATRDCNKYHELIRDHQIDVILRGGGNIPRFTL